MSEPKDTVFQDIGASAAQATASEDASENPVREVDSMCMKCQKTGKTKLLLTVIPYFREVVLMSFECPHCGFKNAEIQHAETIQPEGSIITFKVQNKNDLDRRVVKSTEAVVKIPEVQLEIPGRLSQLTTIEGIITQVITDLSNDQEERKQKLPEVYEQINTFIQKLSSLLEGNTPFTFVLDDMTGNSWVEMKPGEDKDNWMQGKYFRSAAQNEHLGLVDTNGASVSGNDAITAGELNNEVDPSEVQTFHAACPSCRHMCDTHMKMVDIPHFKEVVIMSTTCDACGFKSNEVKTGGAIPPKGRRITLKVLDAEDLTRDILKSETCALSIPELGLDLHPGTLGGRFTTVEGILAQVHDELYGRVYSKESDSMTEEQKQNWQSFLDNLQAAREGRFPITVKLDDPLAQSYLQNFYAPDPDPNMTVEDYERTFEMNEELGLNDMKTENYEKPEEQSTSQN